MASLIRASRAAAAVACCCSSRDRRLAAATTDPANRRHTKSLTCGSATDTTNATKKMAATAPCARRGDNQLGMPVYLIRARGQWRRTTGAGTVPAPVVATAARACLAACPPGLGLRRRWRRGCGSSWLSGLRLWYWLGKKLQIYHLRDAHQRIALAVLHDLECAGRTEGDADGEVQTPYRRL